MKMEKKRKKERKKKIRNTSRYVERSFFESKGYLAPVGSIESVRKHFILRLFRWVLGKVTFYLRAFFSFLSFVSLRKAQKNILEKIEKRVKFRDDTSIQVDENLYIYIINSEGNKEKFMVNYETLALRIGG